MIYLKEIVRASASHKYCFIGSRPRPSNPHTTHITSNTTRTPHTQPLCRHASTARCLHHTEQRRAKRQLGQRGHNLSGNSAAKPQITFEGSLDSKSLSKFILVLHRPITRWTVHKKHRGRVPFISSALCEHNSTETWCLIYVSPITYSHTVLVAEWCFKLHASM